MVGAGDDDHGGLRGHGAQDLPGHVRGGDVRHGRGAGGGPARTRHRLQLRHVLLSHTGQGQAAEEEKKSGECGSSSPQTWEAGE